MTVCGSTWQSHIGIRVRNHPGIQAPQIQRNGFQKSLGVQGRKDIPQANLGKRGSPQIQFGPTMKGFLDIWPSVDRAAGFVFFKTKKNLTHIRQYAEDKTSDYLFSTFRIFCSYQVIFAGWSKLRAEERKDCGRIWTQCTRMSIWRRVGAYKALPISTILTNIYWTQIQKKYIPHHHVRDSLS